MGCASCHFPFHSPVDPVDPVDPVGPVGPVDRMTTSAVPLRSSAWFRAQETGTIPAPRSHAGACTEGDTRVWLFGGLINSEPSNSLFCGDVRPDLTLQWTRIPGVGEVPPVMYGMTLTRIDDRLIVFGGGDGHSVSQELFVFDTVERMWSHVHTVTGQVPPARIGHTATAWKRSVVIVGGWTVNGYVGDVSAVNVDTWEWSRFRVSGPRMPPRMGHTTALVQDHFLVIVGGARGGHCLRDQPILDLNRMCWCEMEQSDIRPRPRFGHAMVSFGDKVIMLGGTDGVNLIRRLEVLETFPQGRVWEWCDGPETPQFTLEFPRGIARHCMCVLGDRLIVLGGVNILGAWYSPLILHGAEEQEMTIHAMISGPSKPHITPMSSPLPPVQNPPRRPTLPTTVAPPPPVYCQPNRLYLMLIGSIPQHTYV